MNKKSVFFNVFSFICGKQYVYVKLQNNRSEKGRPLRKKQFIEVFSNGLLVWQYAIPKKGNLLAKLTFLAKSCAKNIQNLITKKSFPNQKDLSNTCTVTVKFGCMIIFKCGVYFAEIGTNFLRYSQPSNPIKILSQITSCTFHQLLETLCHKK